MCGRYVSAGDLADLSVLLGANPFADDPADDGQERTRRRRLAEQRRFGLAPTDPVPAVVPGPEPEQRQIELLTWGLVPPWADPSTGARRINARVETVCDKPSFRRAIRSRRVLLPADGWYEWTRGDDGSRLPHLVRPADGGLLTFAGLFERWHPRAASPSSKPLLSCAVLTGPAPAPLAWLHERAPLVVPPELHAAWLDPNSEVEALLAAIRAAEPRPMSVRRVSTAVNAVRITGPGLIEPIDDAAPLRRVEGQAALW